MVYVFLADGFEEIEALAPVDMLRRARLDVEMVKVGDEPFDAPQGKLMEIIVKSVAPERMHNRSHAVSARNIIIETDLYIDDIKNLDDLEMIVLPGGAAGVENLYNCEKLKEIIGYCVENNIKISAICAAPSILARLGYLENIKATAYPSFRHYLDDGGAIISEEKVITDGLFTTAAAAGVSIEFALELVNILKGGETARKIGEQILFY